MNYIIIGNNGKKSVEKLSGLLSSDHVILRRFNGRRGTTWKTFNRETNRWATTGQPSFNENDKVIRWGCSVPLTFNGANVYNSGQAITIASAKYVARIMLLDEEIPVPETWLEYGDGRYDVDVIERPFNHSRGRNFVLIPKNTPFQAKHEHYYSELYEKQKEYRVHVFMGKILCVSEKSLVEGVIPANRAITQDSWKVLKWEDYELDVCKESCRAVEALGLHSGAVDIMVDRRNERMPVCICEVNTAPTLATSEYITTRYAKAIDWLFRSDRERWDYTEWTKGKSYAFKNFQLGE